MILHIALFSISIFAIWFCAGLIVDSVDRISKRFNRNGFIVAFFVLGFLTSLGEFSVAANSIISGTPDISAGNLVGASATLLLLVIPILAIVGKKVHMDISFRDSKLLLILGMVLLPAVGLLDGKVTPSEGLASLAAYLMVVWSVRNNTVVSHVITDTGQTMRIFPLLADLGKIAASSSVIFLAGYVLVGKTILFADVLNAPQSLVAALLLSIGTNIPEIAIAARSLAKRRTDVALGNYLGSAAMNTLLFGLVAIMAGPFTFDTTGFVLSFAVICVGFLLFFNLMSSKDTLTRREGIALIATYAVLVGLQVFVLIDYAI